MNPRFTQAALSLAFLLPSMAAEPARTPPGAEAEGDYPFAEVIRRTTGQEVIAFDAANPAHAALLEKLKTAAAAAAESARKAKIVSARANEVGNAIEAHVFQALNAAGLTAQRPRTATGRGQAAGYPDVAIESDPPCYLELKTYNARTANSTQHTFYYSPATETKVTRAALHLLLAYEFEQQTDGGQTIWVPVHFKLVSLHDLTVQLKVEYNQSNRGLYAPEKLLADEPVK
ncbi:MAG TPA: hypothetical protein VLD18_11340 [Verrucomicrobiae bacterium]|nr:hypothetical protein [Verrucomicrobiae bacterium]